MKIEIELSPEQHALVTAVSASLRASPGHALLALAALSLETVPDTEIDGSSLQEKLREAEQGGVPIVVSEWLQCGLDLPPAFLDAAFAVECPEVVR